MYAGCGTVAAGLCKQLSMNEKTLAAQKERAEFEARNSPAGRLLRYCNGRIDGVFPRLVVTASGAMTLWLLYGPAVGWVVAAVALAGEGLDCLVLWLIARRGQEEPPGRGAFAASAWSAAIQALTISFSVAAAWMLAPGTGGRYFAMAYLAGAALNAGIVLPFHARAAVVRLNIYLATLIVLFGADVILDRGDLRSFLQDGFATVIFVYMIKIFLDFTNKGFERRVEMERDLLGQKHRVQQANEDLEEKELESRRLALVAKHANDAIVIRDADGRIEWVNDTFTRMTGYSPQEAIGKTPASLLNGPESSTETTAMINRAVREQRSIVARILNYRKDGSTLWVETSLTPIVEPDGTTSMVIGLERDISDTIARENELAQARVEAEEGARAKTEFLATMSHEIRTPMNGIIGMADLLGRTDLDKEQRVFVSTILASGETLLQIINDILDVTKIEAGKLHILREPFSIVACLNDVMRLLDTLAAGKGIALDLEWTGRGLGGRRCGAGRGGAGLSRAVADRPPRPGRTARARGICRIGLVCGNSGADNILFGGCRLDAGPRDWRALLRHGVSGRRCAERRNRVAVSRAGGGGAVEHLSCDPDCPVRRRCHPGSRRPAQFPAGRVRDSHFRLHDQDIPGLHQQGVRTPGRNGARLAGPETPGAAGQ